MRSQIEHPIKEDLEVVAPIQSDQEHEGTIGINIERTWSDQAESKSQIERQTQDDLEAAVPIRSDQKHKGTIKKKMER